MTDQQDYNRNQADAEACDACACGDETPVSTNAATSADSDVQAPVSANKPLRDSFAKSAACACGAAGGVLLGHISCLITPVVLAFNSAAAVGAAGFGVISMGIGAAATAGGLYLWNKLRGPKAGKIEKRLTYGSALLGLGLSVAFHLSSHKGHMQQDPRAGKEVSTCAPPPRIVPADTVRLKAK